MLIPHNFIYILYLSEILCVYFSFCLWFPLFVHFTILFLFVCVLRVEIVTYISIVNYGESFLTGRQKWILMIWNEHVEMFVNDIKNVTKWKICLGLFNACFICMRFIAPLWPNNNNHIKCKKLHMFTSLWPSNLLLFILCYSHHHHSKCFMNFQRSLAHPPAPHLVFIFLCDLCSLQANIFMWRECNYEPKM